jgi:hypothetical protein
LIKGRRRLVAAASLLFLASWLVVLHSRSYTVQMIDMAATPTQVYEKLIGDRIESFGAAASVVSMFVLLASARFSSESPRWHPVLLALAGVSSVALVLFGQIFPAIAMVVVLVVFVFPPRLGFVNGRLLRERIIGLGLFALLLLGVAEVYLAPKLWNFRPELKALEAFEVAGPFQGQSIPSTFALENPAILKTWAVKREFGEVREDLRQEINRWADPGTVVLLSENPLHVRASRGREFAQLEATFIDLSVPPVIFRHVDVRLSIRRNEYLGEFDY